MVGGIVIVVLLLVIFPVAIMLSGAALAAMIGTVTQDGVDKAHKGSELFDLSRHNPYR